MRSGNLLSTVLFRESRVMEVLPLGSKFILKADRKANKDILFDKSNESARMTISKTENSFFLQLTSDALTNVDLCRFVNPVMKSVFGEFIYSDEGTVVVFNHKAPGVVDIIGSQRELVLQERDSLTIELSREAMSLIQFNNAVAQPGSDDILIQ